MLFFCACFAHLLIQLLYRVEFQVELLVQEVEWYDNLLLFLHDSYHSLADWLLIADLLFLQKVEELSVLQGQAASVLGCHGQVTARTQHLGTHIVLYEVDLHLVDAGSKHVQRNLVIASRCIGLDLLALHEHVLDLG